MKSMAIFICLAILMVLISGCVGVHTKTTAFYLPAYRNSGTITVAAAEAEVNSSLEFAHYKKKFEQKLTDNGYTVVNSPSNAKYVAFVSYGIDNGKSSVVSTPIFGQTGGGTVNSSGTIYGVGGSASYFGSSYSMPTFGVVGTMNDSVTEYTRVIALDIVEAQSLKDGKAVKVYEARAKSTGSCGVIAGVFDEILEALFEGFPGENGKVRTSVVTSKGGC